MAGALRPGDVFAHEGHEYEVQFVRPSKPGWDVVVFQTDERPPNNPRSWYQFTFVHCRDEDLVRFERARVRRNGVRAARQNGDGKEGR